MKRECMKMKNYPCKEELDQLEPQRKKGEGVPQVHYHPPQQDLQKSLLWKMKYNNGWMSRVKRVMIFLGYRILILCPQGQYWLVERLGILLQVNPSRKIGHRCPQIYRVLMLLLHLQHKLWWQIKTKLLLPLQDQKKGKFSRNQRRKQNKGPLMKYQERDTWQNILNYLPKTLRCKLQGPLRQSIHQKSPHKWKKTLRRSNKGKEVMEHTPSSSRVRSSVGCIPKWIRKEIMRSTKPEFHASEEDICDIAKILNKPKSPSHEAAPLEFFTTIQNQDLFPQVVLPPEGPDAKGLSLEDYELKDVMLGRPTWDLAQKMMTMGIVFTQVFTLVQGLCT